MPRSVNDIIENCDELARRFEEYEPRPEDGLDPAALIALREAAGESHSAISTAVADARQAGYSWRIVGSLLGMSDDDVRERYDRPGPA